MNQAVVPLDAMLAAENETTRANHAVLATLYPDAVDPYLRLQLARLNYPMSAGNKVNGTHWVAWSVAKEEGRYDQTVLRNAAMALLKNLPMKPTMVAYATHLLKAVYVRLGLDPAHVPVLTAATRAPRGAKAAMLVEKEALVPAPELASSAPAPAPDPEPAPLPVPPPAPTPAPPAEPAAAKTGKIRAAGDEVTEKKKRPRGIKETTLEPASVHKFGLSKLAAELPHVAGLLIEIADMRNLENVDALHAAIYRTVPAAASGQAQALRDFLMRATPAPKWLPYRDELATPARYVFDYIESQHPDGHKLNAKKLFGLDGAAAAADTSSGYAASVHPSVYAFQRGRQSLVRHGGRRSIEVLRPSLEQAVERLRLDYPHCPSKDFIGVMAHHYAQTGNDLPLKDIANWMMRSRHAHVDILSLSNFRSGRLSAEELRRVAPAIAAYCAAHAPEPAEPAGARSGRTPKAEAAAQP